MKSFKNFVTENISKDDAKIIRQMMDADPVKAKKLQRKLESTRQASERITSGETRYSREGQATRTRPSARDVTGELDARRGDPTTDPEVKKAASRRLSGQPEEPKVGGETKPRTGATNRARASAAAAREGVPVTTEPSKLKPRGQQFKEFPGAGQVRVIKPTQPAPAPKPEAVKRPVPTLSRRGALARKVDPILKDILRQGESRKALERRMSKGYDFNIVRRRGDELLNQLRKDSKPAAAPKPFAEPTSKPRVVKGADTLAKPPKPLKPTTYRNLGLGPETAGRSLNIKGVRASIPVRAPRPQRYSNLGLGQERAGQRVVNRPVEIRVKSQPKTQLPKPPASSKVVANRVVKQMQDAAKKKSASNVRTLGRIGRGLGVVGAGLEAQGEYMRRKEDLGQDTGTAVTGAAARTGGGLTGAALGGKFGAKLGSVLGPKGALVGGAAGSIYGYMVGADQATQAFDNISKGNSKGFAKGLVDFASFRKKASSAK